MNHLQLCLYLYAFLKMAYSWGYCLHQLLRAAPKTQLQHQEYKMVSSNHNITYCCFCFFSFHCFCLFSLYFLCFNCRLCCFRNCFLNCHIHNPPQNHTQVNVTVSFVTGHLLHRISSVSNSQLQQLVYPIFPHFASFSSKNTTYRPGSSICLPAYSSSFSFNRRCCGSSSVPSSDRIYPAASLAFFRIDASRKISAISKFRSPL